jgi:plastocyanin
MPRLPPLVHALACMPLAAAAATLDVAVSGADGQPLADAVVFLEPRDGRPPAFKPATGVEIEQADKQFTQRVTVVPVGTEIAFPNRDKVRHHVYSFSPAKPFELKLYTGTPANPVRFDRPGIAVLGCNIHDHMVAWVVVVETPHYARTDAAGKARLHGVAAGAWRLRSWHPALPPGTPAQEQALVLAAGGGAAAVRLAGARP